MDRLESTTSIPSMDDDSFIRNAYQRLQDAGISPDDFKFSFTCQKCGLRCCLDLIGGTIRFSPYTFAYIRKCIPKVILKYLFDSKILQWITHPNNGPSLQIGSNFCPFLILHWDNSNKELFQSKIKDLNQEFTPALEFIVIHVFTIISEKMKATQQEDSNPSTFVGIPIYELFPIFMTAWNRVTYNHPFLYPNNDPESYLLKFLDFLKQISINDRFMHTSCSIWSVRPEVCRIFPLGRMLILNDDNPNSINNSSSPYSQKVLLQENSCPPSSFTVGEQMSASQFISEQGVTEYELEIMFKIMDFINQFSSILYSFPEDEVAKFYFILVNLLYFDVDYHSDIRVFYENLNLLLDKFLQTFEV